MRLKNRGSLAWQPPKGEGVGRQSLGFYLQLLRLCHHSRLEEFVVSSVNSSSTCRIARLSRGHSREGVSSEASTFGVVESRTEVEVQEVLGRVLPNAEVFDVDVIAGVVTRDGGAARVEVLKLHAFVSAALGIRVSVSVCVCVFRRFFFFSSIFAPLFSPAVFGSALCSTFLLSLSEGVV